MVITGRPGRQSFAMAFPAEAVTHGGTSEREDLRLPGPVHAQHPVAVHVDQACADVRGPFPTGSCRVEFCDSPSVVSNR